VVLVVLAAFAVLPATTGALSGLREGLAVALSVLLLGLLVMITRRQALPRVVGFLCAQNGVFLAVLAAGGMPMMVWLSLAGLVLVAAMVVALLVFRIAADRVTVDRVMGVLR
jgi:hydrogenase-4 component E